MHIDVFPHILPRAYFDRAMEIAPSSAHMTKRMRNIPVLYDLDARFRVMDRHPGYYQLLTIANPPADELAGPDKTPDLVRLGNDQMAELVQKYPDRFVGFAASLPMNNPEAAMREIDHAIHELGAAGIQVHSNIDGKPLDSPDLLPLFERMADLDRPVWIHPTRTSAWADYPGEQRSKFDLWWAFGWPFETSVAMGRLVFSGIFDRKPNLRIITHHCGAMIPYFEGRVGGGLDQLGKRSDDPEDMAARAGLAKRPVDYFKMFYGDTALFGSSAGLECGLAFFGADHILFGTDMPFDPEGGEGFVRDTTAAVERMRATGEEKQMIFEGNARRLLKLRLPNG